MAFLNSHAQGTKLRKSEFEISGFYGLSGLSGSIPNGAINPGTGYQFSIDGKYFFSTNLGIGIGAGYAAYASQSELKSYSSHTPAVDDEAESFEYRVTAGSVKEKQQLAAIEIPVFLAYRKAISSEIRLHGSLGLKVSLPVTATYRCTEGTIETRGYYESYSVEFYDMPNHGFEKIDKVNYSGDLNTSMAYSLFAGVGISLPAGKMGINIGVYGSYGLSSVLKSENNGLISYPGKYQSLTSLCDKVSLVSGGVRIGVRF